MLWWVSVDSNAAARRSLNAAHSLGVRSRLVLYSPLPPDWNDAFVSQSDAWVPLVSPGDTVVFQPPAALDLGLLKILNERGVRIVAWIDRLAPFLNHEGFWGGRGINPIDPFEVLAAQIINFTPEGIGFKPFISDEQGDLAEQSLHNLEVLGRPQTQQTSEHYLFYLQRYLELMDDFDLTLTPNRTVEACYSRLGFALTFFDYPALPLRPGVEYFLPNPDRISAVIQELNFSTLHAALEAHRQFEWELWVEPRWYPALLPFQRARLHVKSLSDYPTWELNLPSFAPGLLLEQVGPLGDPTYGRTAQALGLPHLSLGLGAANRVEVENYLRSDPALPLGTTVEGLRTLPRKKYSLPERGTSLPTYRALVKTLLGEEL